MAMTKSSTLETLICENYFHAQSKDAYKEKIRSLFSNLRDATNPTLCLRVLCGSLSVNAFSSMTAEEMKSCERQEEDRRIQEENLFKARGAQPQEAETDQFKCGKCHQRKCRYYQMQTRSADGISHLVVLNFALGRTDDDFRNLHQLQQQMEILLNVNGQMN